LIGAGSTINFELGRAAVTPTREFVQGLDHLSIGVADLARETANYCALFGTEPQWSGMLGDAPAAVFSTANVSVCLRQSERAGGLERLCFRVGAQSEIRRRLSRVGLDVRESALPDPLAELYCVDAADRAGTAGLLALDPASSRGLELAFVHREKPLVAPVAPRISGLDHLVISSTEAQGTAFLLAAQLDLDLRLDIQRPQWGARMMFFRCGDLILEVVQQLNESAAECAHDSFFGLCWRVAQAETLQAALAGEGFDVSTPRDGRKPGTTVFTVRDKNAGVETLMLEPAGER
jgi:catechol 2,3-dioxygenase-like lactoylglutathione lyase family enzyme